MRIYLDNCCFNRPFDDQRQTRIRLEAEAKLSIQAAVRNGSIELAWSYILDLENAANPFEERRFAIGAWRGYAIIDVEETVSILAQANELKGLGLKAKDALHVSCAVAAQCECFLTTDQDILRRGGALQDIRVLDPTAFVRELNL